MRKLTLALGTVLGLLVGGLLIASPAPVEACQSCNLASKTCQECGAPGGGACHFFCSDGEIVGVQVCSTWGIPCYVVLAPHIQDVSVDGRVVVDLEAIDQEVAASSLVSDDEGNVRSCGGLLLARSTEAVEPTLVATSGHGSGSRIQI